RRSWNVDVVDADAGASDHFQLVRARENLRRNLRRRTDREPVIIADHGGEFFLVLAEIRLEIHLDTAILENLHGRGRERVGNQNFGCHGQAAFESAAFDSAKANSSHGSSASISEVSTVAPPQMRICGGASRWPATS